MLQEQRARSQYGEPETSDEIALGHMYEYGERVPQDFATALHWYQLAAATRDTAAEAGVQRVELILNLPRSVAPRQLPA
ncbi:MAG: SEL1-like repeat protein [Candidatus Tumulicola sp.]